MLRLTGISENLINQSLLRIGYRLAVSIPFQFGGFFVIAVLPQDLRHEPCMWALLSVMAIGSILRVALWRLGPRILTSKNGQATFRFLFATAAGITGLCWGLAFSFAYYLHPSSASSHLLWAANSGICATVVGAWSFDLVVTLFASLLFSLPALITLAVFGGREYYFGVGSLLWTIYITLNIVSSNRVQWTLLRNFEAIVAKDGLIQTMLSSIDEAFLIFDRDGNCSGNPSKSTERLLGVNPIGKHISEILEPDIQKRKLLADWYSILLLDRLDFTETAEHGPKRLETNEQKTILSLNFHPMRDGENALNQVVLTASDVTREVQEQKRTQAE